MIALYNVWFVLTLIVSFSCFLTSTVVFDYMRLSKTVNIEAVQNGEHSPAK